MTARLIDGKAVAAELRATIATQVQQLAAAHGLVPGLATILVGRDPASETYVGSKNRVAAQVGLRSFDHRLLG